jgi:WD40 repeat protein
MFNRLQGSKVMRQSGVEALITEEPYDRIGHVRICGGDGPVMAVSTRRFPYSNRGLASKPEEYWGYKHQVGGVIMNASSGRTAIVFGNWAENFVFAKIKVFEENKDPVCTQEFYSRIARSTFSPDGRMIAVISDDQVQLLDIDKCKVRRPARFATHRSGAVAFGKSSNDLFSVGFDGILYRLSAKHESSNAIGAPLRFSALDYHHVLSPSGTYLASRERASIYLMDLDRYLELIRIARELRDTPYEYIGERERQAFRAAYLKIDDQRLLNYGFSPSSRLLYTVDQAGTVAVWHTQAYAVDEKVDPPDPSWQCPDTGCEGDFGRNRSVVLEDARRDLIAHLTTSLTDCGGDKKHDCLLVSNLSISDKRSGLTVRTFELQERTAPLWQRITKLAFDDSGKLFVGNGAAVRLFHLDLESLKQRVCTMAGDHKRIRETDRYLDKTIRSLFPKAGYITELCRKTEPPPR